MNGKQYKNIIDNTMKHIDNETKSDSVKTAIEIFKNRGIEFPDESVEYVKEILNSDNYMSWEHCEVSDLHDYANNGVAAVGIDENRIVVIAPESDDEAEEKYPNILTYSDLTEEDFENMTFYAATASYYGGGTETPKESTLDKLKAKFPHGKYWNHVDMDVDNNPDGWTDTPCKVLSGYKHDSSTCNSCFGASQCAGFAAQCGYDATGTDYRGWPKYVSASYLNMLKPGDILRFIPNKSEHSVYVTGINGETITYGECNGEGYKNYCQIYWDKTTTKTIVKNNFVSFRSAPVKLDV